MAVLSCLRLGMLLAVSTAAMAQGTNIPSAVPNDAGAKLPQGFVAFSIEANTLPNFAGNSTHPNAFTQNLMSSIADLQGVPPPIRNGGNSQDQLFFDPHLDEPIVSNGQDSYSIGSAYFDAFNAWPKGTKLSHGFNLKNQSSGGHQNLIDTAAAACKGIDPANLAYWEMGNEPDLYPGQWDQAPSKYVAAYQQGVQAVQDALGKACPSFASVGYLGPSYSKALGKFNETGAFGAGLNKLNNIKMISVHNYIDGADSPGVTLQGTLLNHSRTAASVGAQVAQMHELQAAAPGIPFVLGEANSLYHGGHSGLSNVFGSALWTVDFSLRAASQGIQRVHFHQGAASPYNAWHAVADSTGPPRTMPPFYGNVAVAAFLGADEGVQVVDFPLHDDRRSLYAAYVGGKLRRVAALNMAEWNSTHAAKRPTAPFTLNVQAARNATVRRLQAPGSDATDGVTFDGTSYDYAKQQGKAIPAQDHQPESVAVTNGALTLDVAASEVAIVDLA